MSGSSGSAGRREAALAPASVDERRAAGRRAIAADRRHQRTAMARAVKTMTTRVTKKARAMRARAKRVMTETSPREEGDDGHKNQLGTNSVAMARTVVATTARVTTTAQKGQKGRQQQW